MGDRREPRRFLIDPTQFGRHPDARWRAYPDRERVEVMEAYIQHLAICELRSIFGHNLDTELARLTGDAPTYLRRRLSGEYRTTITDIYTWALAAGDISIIPPIDSIDDLLP